MAKFAGQTVAEIINHAGQVEVKASSMIRTKILNNLDKEVELEDHHVLSLTNKGQEAVVQISLQSANKIKELLWTIDKTLDGTLVLPLNCDKVLLKKTSGCPLFSGLHIQSQNDWLFINHGWDNLINRTFKWSIKDTTGPLMSILYWLNVSLPDLQIPREMDIEWLDVFQGKTTSTYWQLKERLSMIHMWILNSLTMDAGAKCYPNNMRNTANYNQMIRFMGWNDTIVHHQSVIPHKTLIIKRKNWLYREFYHLLTKKGKIMSIKANDKASKIKELMIETMQDMSVEQEPPLWPELD